MRRYCAQQRLQRRILREHVAARPRLGRRAAPRAVDEADRHVARPLQLAREEVADRREVRDARRRGDHPGRRRVHRRHVVLRVERGDALHREQADARMVGGRDLLVGVLRLAHLPLHVRLARADPDLADEHVGEALRRGRAGDHELVRAARRFRRQRDAPAAVTAGGRRDALRAQADLDALVGRGPAPDADRHLLLQHHVVGEDRRQPRIGRGGRRGQEQQEEERHAMLVAWPGFYLRPAALQRGWERRPGPCRWRR